MLHASSLSLHFSPHRTIFPRTTPPRGQKQRATWTGQALPCVRWAVSVSRNPRCLPNIRHEMFSTATPWLLNLTSHNHEKDNVHELVKMIDWYGIHEYAPLQWQSRGKVNFYRRVEPPALCHLYIKAIFKRIWSNPSIQQPWKLCSNVKKWCNDLWAIMSLIGIKCGEHSIVLSPLPKNMLVQLQVRY